MNRENLEVEIKLQISRLDETEKSIRDLGFEVRVERAFEDNWVFDFPDQRLRAERCLFRLREYDGRALITYKSSALPSTHFKIREELETEVGSGAMFYQMMERLGMQVTFRYQKYRTAYADSNNPHSAHIYLDETPIGNYLEIEGSEAAILHLAGNLGYSPGDFIRDSYLALYLKQHPASREMRMVFQEPK